MGAQVSDTVDNTGNAIQRLRARMPATAMDRADRIAIINSSYVRTFRDTLIDKAFDRIIENIAATADTAGRNADKRRALYVIGESGSGKSTTLERTISRRSELQPYVDNYGRTIRPAVSFEAPKPLTLKLLARTGLKAIGYDIQRDRQENQMWELFKEQIKEREVLLLHIDEMQHVMRGAKNANLQDITDVVKSLVQTRDWPMHAIFSGVPSLIPFIQAEPQMQNRDSVIVFEQLRYPADAMLLKKTMMHTITEIAKMDVDPRLHQTDELIHKLIIATNGGFGTAIHFIKSTIAHALRSGREVVEPTHFAEVYCAFTGCSADGNVFSAKDWSMIIPKFALSELLKSSGADGQLAGQHR